MARYQAEDHAAFVELFQRYAPLLLRVMQYRLDRREDAHDLVQQTFLQLHRSRADFRPGAKLRPWLLTIAMNLKRRHLRRRRHAETSLDGDMFDDAIAGLTWESGIDDEEQLRTLLEGLPPDQRRVIVLHWKDGLSFAEVANVVGASLSAVKVRAHRGYAAIRESFARNEGHEAARARSAGKDSDEPLE